MARSSEKIPVALPSGIVVSVSLEDLEDLESRMVSLQAEASIAREEYRTAFVEPETYGLTPVLNPGKSGWLAGYAREEGLGRLPYGVPIIAYVEAEPWYEQGLQEDEWHLVLSCAKDYPIDRCKYDDVEGFKRLTTRITDDMDVLETQLVLTHSEAPHNVHFSNRLTMRVDGITHYEFVQKVINQTESLPAIPAGTLMELQQDQALTVHLATLMDPSLCRAVALPSVISIRCSRDHLTLGDMDRFLAAHGLTSLKKSPKGWRDTQRLATVRGSASQLSHVPTKTWSMFLVEHPDVHVDTVGALRGTYHKVVNYTPLTYDERRSALTQVNLNNS